MRILKQLGMMTSVLGMISAAAVASAQSKPADADNFYKSKNVIVRAVIFKNQYKMTVAGNLFLPTGMDQTAKRAAIIVGHPMGAVKEQSADLYATKMGNRVLSPCPWTWLSGAAAPGNRAMPCRRTSMPRPSAPLWTI